MKLSQLIRGLQWIAEGKDDCEVVVRDIVNGINYDVCSIGFYARDNKVHIEV